MGILPIPRTHKSISLKSKRVKGAFLLFYFSNIRPQRVSFCIYQVRAATAS